MSSLSKACQVFLETQVYLWAFIYVPIKLYQSKARLEWKMSLVALTFGIFFGILSCRNKPSKRKRSTMIELDDDVQSIRSNLCVEKNTEMFEVVEKDNNSTEEMPSTASRLVCEPIVIQDKVYYHIDKENGVVLKNVAEKLNGFMASLTNSGLTDWLKSALLLPYTKSLKGEQFILDDPQALKRQLESIKEKLDKNVYKMDDVKSRIIDSLLLQQTCERGSGKVLALCGPPGVGKTKLVRSAIDAAFGLPVFTINLAGMRDGKILQGFSRTYVDSRYGKIADALIRAKGNNCVIYLDEIDKIPETGIEVQRTLTHILDPEQNQAFQDHYFDDLNIDLSRVTFIASMNDASLVDPVLKDRLDILHVPAFKHEEQIEIVKKFLIPDLTKSLHFDLDLADAVTEKVIWKYLDEESGLRQLKSTLSQLIARINRMFLVRSESIELVENEKSKLPLIHITDTLATTLLEEICSHRTPSNESFRHLYG